MTEKNGCPAQKILLRQANSEDDWQQMKSLLQELLSFERSLRPQRKKTSIISSGPSNYVHENIIKKNGFCLLAIKQATGQVIGFMNGWVESGDGLDKGDNRIGYISDAYIQPEFRNAFIFKKMGNSFIEHFKSMNISRINFDTLGSNTRMQKLLVLSGFTVHRIVFEKEI